MGKIIEVESNKILPSQDFVKEDTSKFIFFKYFRGENINIPIPIVRYSKDKKYYIAIDGHNLLVIWEFLGIKCKVYLVEDENDFISGKDFPNAKEGSIEQRNKELKEKYNSSLEESIKVQKKGVKTIADLRLKGRII